MLLGETENIEFAIMKAHRQTGMVKTGDNRGFFSLTLLWPDVEFWCL